MRFELLAVRDVADGQVDDGREAGLVVRDQDAVRAVRQLGAVCTVAVPVVGRLAVLVGVAADSVAVGAVLFPVRLDAVVPVGGQATDPEDVALVLGVTPLSDADHDLLVEVRVRRLHEGPLVLVGAVVVEQGVVPDVVRDGVVVRVARADRVHLRGLAVVLPGQDSQHDAEGQKGDHHESSGCRVVAGDTGAELLLLKVELGLFVHRGTQSTRGVERLCCCLNLNSKTSYFTIKAK